jgi:hypothetical protein
MARLDDLPADQKAVLQLVLRQGRSYEEIAGLLKISQEAVRDRALNGLDALGPDSGSGLPEDRQDDVGDHLLGQQPASKRAATREFLEGSASGRAWARVVSGELRSGGLADDLPDIPAEREAPAAVAADGDALDEPAPERGRDAAPAGGRRSSKLGGILVLTALLAAVVALVLVLTGVIGGNDNSSKAQTTTPATQTAGGGQTKVEAQINLQSPAKGSKSLGVANVVVQDGQRALAVIGQDLSASPRYVLWLYNSATDAKFLGFFPPVTDKGQAKGRLQGLVAAPDDLTKFKQLVVTRERIDQPKRPGTIVLQGQIGQ